MREENEAREKREECKKDKERKRMKLVTRCGGWAKGKYLSIGRGGVGSSGKDKRNFVVSIGTVRCGC